MSSLIVFLVVLAAVFIIVVLTRGDQKAEQSTKGRWVTFDDPRDMPREELVAYLDKLEDPVEARAFLDHCNKVDFKLGDLYGKVANVIGKEAEAYLLKELEYLEPKQVKRWLEDIKEEGFYVTTNVFKAAMRKKNITSTEKYLNLIAKKKPEEVWHWYLQKKMEKEYILDEVFEKLGEKLIPYHEPLLLAELETIQPAQVTAWVDTQKKKGYFFSDAVYDKASEMEGE